MSYMKPPRLMATSLLGLTDHVAERLTRVSRARCAASIKTAFLSGAAAPLSESEVKEP